uniref:Uncharacterized protein n=2 Tax=Caenorhabditis japonica TaxID=281687 RepID=A0A8R1E8P4_CAEJA
MMVRQAVRGQQANYPNGYRLNLVGRGSGGSTMAHHAPLNSARLATRGASGPRMVSRGGGATGLRSVSVQQPLHVSASSPAFHYMEENMNPSTTNMKTPGTGVFQPRHLQHQQSFPANGNVGTPQRVLMSSSRLDTPSTSTTVSPRLLTARSHTASPASTVSTGDIVPPPKKSLEIAPGSIVRRTVQTKEGNLQTQYLKAFINEKGQKIYRMLSPVSASQYPRGNHHAASPAARGLIRGGGANGGGTMPRVGNTMVNKNGERLMVVRNHVGPNGQVLVRKVVNPTAQAGPTRIMANGRGQQVYR